MNTDAKLPNKITTNQIQEHIKRSFFFHSTCFYYKTTEHMREIHHPVTTSKAQIFEKKEKIVSLNYRLNHEIILYDQLCFIPGM